MTGIKKIKFFIRVLYTEICFHIILLPNIVYVMYIFELGSNFICIFTSAIYINLEVKILLLETVLYISLIQSHQFEHYLSREQSTEQRLRTKTLTAFICDWQRTE